MNDVVAKRISIDGKVEEVGRAPYNNDVRLFEHFEVSQVEKWIGGPFAAFRTGSQLFGVRLGDQALPRNLTATALAGILLGGDVIVMEIEW